MVALGLEAILIGNIVQGVGLAIGSHPAHGSTDAEGLLVSAGVLQLSLLLAGDSITSFVTESEKVFFKFLITIVFVTFFIEYFCSILETNICEF